MYWDKVWDKRDLEEYEKYLVGYEGISNIMTREFEGHHCKKICDCACGFGANSVILHTNGFDVYGFDIAEASVWLTEEALAKRGLKRGRFKVASLTSTGYEEGEFDGVAVRAALDHLSVEECKLAVEELARITKAGGLIYASFDSLEEDDLNEPHQVLEDGSFLYNSGNREGLLFHHYEDKEILALLGKYEVLAFEKDRRGNRHIVILNKS